MQQEATGRIVEARRTWSRSFSRLAMKIELLLTENYLQRDMVCI
jgi:hypothetical protein